MIMADRNIRPARSLGRYAGAGFCAILLAGCAATGQKGNVLGGDADYKDAVGVFANPAADPSTLDPIAAAAFWGTRFDREPQNAEVGVQYSSALRKIGSNDEAVKVMAKAAKSNPDSIAVNLEYGKALVEAGRSFEAVRYFETVVVAEPNNWRARSAYGVALDQIGENELARAEYDKALLVAPGAVSVINNKGLSYALSGDLKLAEATLRAAATSPRGDARVRQNLALVLAIKGDMREATRLARSDLPPQVADENIDYFRSLMTQPAYWQEFAGDNIETPKFDAEPSEQAPAKAAPLPQLKEEPKKEEAKPGAAPIALGGATAPVNASTGPAGASSMNFGSAPEIKQ